MIFFLLLRNLNSLIEIGIIYIVIMIYYEKIIAVMDEVFREFWEHGDKYRKKPQP